MDSLKLKLEIELVSFNLERYLQGLNLVELSSNCILAMILGCRNILQKQVGKH